MRKISLALILSILAATAHAGVQGQLRQGGNLYQQQKYGSALNVYNQILQKHPDEQRTLFNAGNAYYRLNEYTQAEEVYKKAAEQDGEYKQHALFNLGNAYYKAGDKQKAIESYKEAIVLNPQDKDAIHNLQLLMQEQQKNQNKNNQNQDNSDESSDNQSQQNQQDKGQKPQEAPQAPQQNPQMNKQDADRVMAMAKEQKFQSGNVSREPEESVEKDW